MSLDGRSQSLASSSISNDVPSIDVSSDRSSRKRKPTARYVEQSSHEVLKELHRNNVISGKKRGRKSNSEQLAATPESSSGKWKAYKSKISSLARSIARDLHAMSSYEVEDGNFTGMRSVIPKEELIKCTDRIRKAKLAILEQFAAMDAEYSDHTRWPQLKTGFDEDDDVSVDDIMCSLCNLPDEENNDILFCDRMGCLRAYHQQCLEPPQVTEPDADADWFCRQCECIDDCLDLVGEILGHDTENYHELFPELYADTEGADGRAAIMDDDSEDDVDYAPSGSEEGDDSIAGSSDDESAKSDTSEKVGAQLGRKDRKRRSDLNRNRSLEAESGDGSEGGDNSSNNDSEDTDSDLGSASDSGGDIDEDELQGLLRDAAEDDVLLIQTISAGHSAACAGEEPRRSLRARRAVDYTLPEDKSKVPEGMADVGKKVAAMVRKGVLSVGEITSFRHAEVGWVEKKDKSAWRKIGADGNEDGADEPVSSVHRSEDTGAECPDGNVLAEDTRDAVEAAAIVDGSKNTVSTTTSEIQHGLSLGDTSNLPLPNALDNAESALYWSGPEEPSEQMLEQGVWTARFEAAGVEREIGLETLKEFFELYAECAERLEEDVNNISSKSRSVENAVAEQGKLDTANVLTHKRTRVRLDYAALSREMFGDKADSDSDDSSVQDSEVVQEVLHDMHQAQLLEKKGRDDSAAASGGDDGSVRTVHTAASSATSTAVDSTRNTSIGNDQSGVGEDAEEGEDGLSKNEAEAKKQEKMRRYQAEYRAKKRLEKTSDPSAQPRKRGRPRKDLQSPAAGGVSTPAANGAGASPSAGVLSPCGDFTASGKKRGRPRKNPITPLSCDDKRVEHAGVVLSSNSADVASPVAKITSSLVDDVAPQQPSGQSQQGITHQGLLRLLASPGQEENVHRLLHPGSFSGSNVGDSYWPNSLQSSPRSANADTSNPSSETKKRGRPKGSKNKVTPLNAGLEKKPRTKKAKLHPVDVPAVGLEGSAPLSAQPNTTTTGVPAVVSKIEDSIDGCSV